MCQQYVPQSKSAEWPLRLFDLFHFILRALVSGVGHLFARETIGRKLTMAKGGGGKKPRGFSKSFNFSLSVSANGGKRICLFCQTPRDSYYCAFISVVKVFLGSAMFGPWWLLSNYSQIQTWTPHWRWKTLRFWDVRHNQCVFSNW